MIAYERHAPNQADLYVALCAGNHVVTAGANQAFMENFRQVAHQSQPSVATSGAGFVLTFAAAETPGSNHDVFLCGFSVAHRRLALADRRILAGVNAEHDRAPRLVSHYETGGSSGFGPFGLVYQANDVTGQGDIRLATYATERVCGVQSTLCLSDPNSTSVGSMLSVTGSGTNFSPRTMRVVGLPLQSTGLFLASRSSNSTGTLPPGSMGVLCLTGAIGRFGPPVNSGSTGQVQRALDPLSIPQPTGNVAALVGDNWNFQYWHRDTSSGSATSNLSNAVSIFFE